MEQYTPRERSEIVEIYIQQNKSIVKTQRAFKKLKNVKVRLLRTSLSVYTKNVRLVRLFLIRRGQIKVDQGDRPRISLPYEPVLRGPQEHPKNAVLSSCAWLGPLYNGLFALICICSRTKFNWRKDCCLRTSLVDWNDPKKSQFGVEQIKWLRLPTAKFLFFSLIFKKKTWSVEYGQI